MTHQVIRPEGESGHHEKWRIAHFLLGRCNVDSANGIDKTVYHLAVRQASAGHDVRVLSLTPKPALPVPGATVHTFAPRVEAPRFIPSPVRDLLVDRSPWNLPRGVIEELMQAPPDVVHFHHTQVPQAVRISGFLRRTGIPYCVTLHGALAGEARLRRRWIKRLYRAVAERTHLDGAAFLHGISEADAEGARAVGLRAPIEVIPNGVDVEALVPGREQPLAELHAELRGRCVLLFVGRLDPAQKGLDLLLEALSRTRAQLGLALVGPGFRSGREALEARARRCGIEGRVAFLGPKFGDELVGCLRGADGFVHPSRWEAGVPFSVLEAAACGLPCLLTEGADPGNVLTGRGGGVLLPLEPDGMAAELTRFAELTAAARSELGRRARSIVSDVFGWDTIAGEVVRAYGRHCVRG